VVAVSVVPLLVGGPGGPADPPTGSPTDDAVVHSAGDAGEPALAAASGTTPAWAAAARRAPSGPPTAPRAATRSRRAAATARSVPDPAPGPAPQAGSHERAAAILGRGYRDARRKPTRPAWIHPLPGAEITSCYGERWGVMHAGIDLAAPSDTTVRAAGAGMVVGAGWSYPGYGISVLVDHGGEWLTHYAHLSAVAVRPGQRVAVGQALGREGSTGNSTGPHLHFEVHDGRWRQIDPAAWLRARGVPIGC
jgi:murein DD-endopeptidase MepM/ murein hydrolase activator NlpD